MSKKALSMRRIACAVLMALTALAWRGASAQSVDPNELLKAARNGEVGHVLYFLKKRIDPQYQDSSGQTALMAAAAQGNRRVVDVLIDAGARVDTQDNFGRTALGWAAYGGHVSTVERLLGSGADINVQDKEGLTPIMLAIREDHLVVVETLVDRKPNLDLADYTGRTAMGWAQAGRDRRIESLLRRAGARE